MGDRERKFRFRKFQVYTDARRFAKKVKDITKRYFPDSERFGITSQLWRAADSIILNIAEGADRGTDKDFAHFLNQAHTSLNEVVACTDLAVDNEYLTKKKQEDILIDAEALANQLTAFRRSLICRSADSQKPNVNRQL